MGKRAANFQRSRMVVETARIICEESIPDYRLAKLKAAERLGLRAESAMPSNADVQAAVLEHQRLFGGRQYAERLRLLRNTAVQAMRLLAEFEPRLVGAVASGATTDAHKVQLQGFADQPERLDVFLHDRGIRFEAGARRYRWPEGRNEEVPTVVFEAGDVAVEMAIFPLGDTRRAPLSPIDGAPMKRLDLAAVEKLATEEPETFG